MLRSLLARGPRCRLGRVGSCVLRMQSHPIAVALGGSPRAYATRSSLYQTTMGRRSRNKASHMRWPYQSPQQQPHRCIFIQTSETPNPDSLKFIPDYRLLAEGVAPRDFPDPMSAVKSPLAAALFLLDGVVGVFVADTFVSVNKSPEADWITLKPMVFDAIMEFMESGRPVFNDNAEVALDTQITEDDDDVVAMIKELLETRVRPQVQQDGGDIQYVGFDNGVVKLKMQGSCSGCPSSGATLKNGIERLLMHYVAEVEGVLEVEDKAAQTASAEQLAKLEQRIANQEAQQ